MKIKVISDSSCDMKIGEHENLQIVPLTISTESGKIWVDNDDVDVDSMLDTLEKYKGRSYTSCPQIDYWIKSFEGADIIYVVTMTSGLSGTYNSAVAASKIYKEKNPNVKIRVFDTLSTCAQQWLIIDYIYELISKNFEFDEICKFINEYIKKTKFVYMLKSLHNFAQNGRISKTIAAAIGIFGINIIASVTSTGEIKPVSKCRGDKKVIQEFMNQLKINNYSGNKLYISHVNNISLAQEIKKSILNVYSNAKIKIRKTKAICSYYAEKGGILIGFETV